MTWKQVLPELARLDDPARMHCFLMPRTSLCLLTTSCLFGNSLTRQKARRKPRLRRWLFQLQRGCIHLQDMDALKKLANL